MSRLRTTLATAALLTLAACGGAERPAAVPPPEQSDRAGDQAGDPGAAGPLDWQPTGHAAGDRVVVGHGWTAVATETEVVLEDRAGDREPVVVPAPDGRSVDAVLLERDAAVVSFAAEGETAGAAVRVDLAEGSRSPVVSPQPANGGSWAMYDDSLYYPALGEGGAYCLATLAVGDGNGEEGWCAPARTGFSNLTAGPHGVGLLTFDDARPVACRTVRLLDPSGQPQPVEGPTGCRAWDVAATATGVVWSEVPREQRQETARFSARVDGEVRDLGRGSTGTLLPCGDDAFFVRDPARRTDPARLMRWDGSALTVAYESAATGDAFLGEPSCADATITLSSFGEGGDEQVWARVDSAR